MTESATDPDEEPATAGGVLRSRKRHELSESEVTAEEARELLARERTRIESGLASSKRGREGLGEELDDATDVEDDAELISDEQVDEALAVQLRDELEAVERAEARVEAGTYGLSVESGEPIPKQRLEAIPWAERTAEEQERRA
jgi:DnaK suppressor protein